MPELLWIVAAIVVLTVVQILLFQYLRGNRGFSLNARGTDGSTRAGGTESRPSIDPPEDGPADGRRCADCGALNDAQFTFCRNCAAKIAA